jgi:hypothetical protein
MSAHFSRLLDGFLSRIDVRQTHKGNPEPATSAAKVESDAERRRKWFEEFAAARLMPLLSETAEAVKQRGRDAKCWLAPTDSRLAVELVIVPPHLPEHARPPRLTIYAGEGEYPLIVESTGTFPGIGATDGFGAEVDYDSIHTGQVEEKVLDFVRLATSA